MDAKAIIHAAKDYVADLYAVEGAVNIGLEELRFDDQNRVWSVTAGFTRAWEGRQGLSEWSRDGAPWPRTFKTVDIDDDDGKILGLKNCPVAA